jgi:hypothetical protein
MRAGFLCSCLFAASMVLGQSFPQSFVGHWEGDLVWYQTGKKSPQKVRMQLIVQPADTAGQYSWQLIYGEKSQDIRPYLLKPGDRSKDHWIVDERNGIVLDQYLVGDKFTCAFTVQASTILASYWLEKKKLHVEFYGISSKPLNTTGGTSAEIPPVASYAMKSYQKAVLKRRKR